MEKHRTYLHSKYFAIASTQNWITLIQFCVLNHDMTQKYSWSYTFLKRSSKYIRVIQFFVLFGLVNFVVFDDEKLQQSNHIWLIIQKEVEIIQ
jgi:hypothetical protein